MMPWDEQLNNTVKVSLMFHAVQTHHLESTTENQSLLPESDPRKWKFDLSTSKRLSYAFRRVLEVVPTSANIVHDTLAVFESILKIRDAGGVRLTRRTGKCNEPIANKKKRGGARKRKQALDDCGCKIIHIHVELGMRTSLEDCKSRFDGADGTKPVIKKQRVYEQEVFKIVTIENS
jgi:hypothetical protein